jgi:hypothetical protein
MAEGLVPTKNATSRLRLKEISSPIAVISLVTLKGGLVFPLLAARVLIMVISI